jgi:hypothetical protein
VLTESAIRWRLCEAGPWHVRSSTLWSCLAVRMWISGSFRCRLRFPRFRSTPSPSTTRR